MTAKIKINLTHPNAKMPARATTGSAGYDIHCVEDFLLRPGVPTLVKTGLQLELPPGYEAQVRPRSGLALKHGITVLNSPGTIDSDYRGEVGVVLLAHISPRDIDVFVSERDSLMFDAARGLEVNLCDFIAQPHTFKAGDKIAQLVIQRVPDVEFAEVAELGDTQRGDGGFGSTGR